TPFRISSTGLTSVLTKAILDQYDSTVMAGYRSAHQNVIFLREYFQHFQRFYFYTVTAHTASHTHSFKYTARVRGTTNRTRSTGTVMLTMRRFSYTGKTMALNNTLKTFTF